MEWLKSWRKGFKAEGVSEVKLYKTVGIYRALFPWVNFIKIESVFSLSCSSRIILVYSHVWNLALRKQTENDKVQL